MFPTIKFQCNGHIQGVKGIAYYDRRLYYNRTLVLNLQLWRNNQSHYAPTGINNNATFSPEGFASASDSPTAPLYVNISGDYPFIINDASIDVMAGDILGIYLPPRTSYDNRTQVNSIPIALADEFQTPFFRPALSTCWSPTLGRTQCHYGFSIKTPLLSLDLVSTSVPTGKLAIILYLLYV